MKTNVCVCVCVCSVSQSCQTLCNPMDCSPPGSPVHGLFQAGILEWVAISFSRGFSQSGDQTCVSCIDRQILWPTTPLRTVLCVCVYMYIHPVGSVSLENPNACSLPLNFTRIYVYCFEICLKESLDSKRSSFLTFSVARIPFPLGNRNPWLSQHSNPLFCACQLVVVVQWLSCVRLLVTPWTAAYQVHCPLLSPGVCSNSCLLSWWCHPTISSSVIPFSFCLQSWKTPSVQVSVSTSNSVEILWYSLVETFLTWKISYFNQ